MYKYYCVFILIAAHIAAAYPADENENCARWASEGECINNPAHLWTHCQTSCAASKDTDERCSRWAEEGECTANPGYVALHCHQSCGHALSWNPYLRRRLNLASLPGDSVDTNCPQVTSILHIAVSMHERVKVLFFGGYEAANLGLRLDAPSDYLGSLPGYSLPYLSLSMMYLTFLNLE